MSSRVMERQVAGLLGYCFVTDLGWMALTWRDAYPTSLAFDLPSELEAVRLLHDAHCEDAVEDGDLPRNVRAWVKRLVRYAAGEKVDLQDIPLDPADGTAFQRRVVEGCQQIPRGKTISYGELAEIAGSPNAARAVGNVMATNPLPLIVPCHRVVGAAGSLGGYSASSGLAMKRRLLKLEGVAT